MGLKAYLPLLKLRIGVLITFCAIVGFVATTDQLSLAKLLFLTIATFMASAGAGAFNHFFDRDIDGIMKRTSTRPLPSGQVSNAYGVLGMAIGLMLGAFIFSSLTLNYIVSLHLFLGAFTYVVIYTVWLKRRSWLNIIIGGAAGSFAVLAGAASSSADFCLTPIWLALVLFFWTPSHFWSFAIVHKEEYRKAGVPMLPVIMTDSSSAWCILVNTALLVGSSLMAYFYGTLGGIYLAMAVATGAYFLYWNVRLILKPTKEVAWKNFKASMAYLGILLTAIIFDVIL